MRDRYVVTLLSDRHAIVHLTDRIALITQALKRPGKGGRRAIIVSGYFGFGTEKEAQAFISGLHGYFPKAFCQLRSSQRLSAKLEVKVRKFEGLEQFAWALVSKPAPMTADEAKASIQPPINQQEAPVHIRSRRPLTVAGRAIE